MRVAPEPFWLADINFLNQPQRDLQLVMHAAAFAAMAHARQKRKASDQPYINHLLRVGENAARAGMSPEAVAAALLHDVVEDTPVRLGDLRREFPERVVRLVQLMMQWWPDDAPREVKEFERPKYYGAILRDPDAIEIKLLDRADNLRDMIEVLPRARRWAERYLERTREELKDVLRASRNRLAQKIYLDAMEALECAIELSYLRQTG